MTALNPAPFNDSREFQQSNETKMNEENDIIVTARDHAELSSVIAVAGKVSQRVKWELRLLENELKRARIVAPEDVPHEVITMNSCAELLDLESGERMEFTLVFPIDENVNEGKISVLAPLGTAMLGYRVGDEFVWHVPHGLRRLKVTKLLFQPEASLKKGSLSPRLYQACAVGHWNKNGLMDEEYIFWDNQSYMQQLGITK